MKTFLTLNGPQWIELILLVQVSFILADAFAGHYRSGFRIFVQYLPFIVGLFLILSLLIALITNGSSKLLAAAGWISTVAGMIGFGFHYRYAFIDKPKGMQWLLHYLMYGAPILAPLSLSISGFFMVSVANGAGNSRILGLAALFLSGLLLQTFPLHFRGAFNNVLMYLPFIVPLAAVLMILFWFLTASALSPLKWLLWGSFFTGFIGLGMHLRGADRQRGGLYVRSFNLLEGPPAFAPGLYSTVSGIALVSVYLM